jgi:hypothetical protein
MRPVGQQVARRLKAEHEILDELAKLMGGEPLAGVNYPDIGKRIGRSRHAIFSAKQILSAAGILRTTVTYPPGRGRVSTWELTLPVDRAHEELTREQERQLERPGKGRRQGRQVVVEGPLRSLPILKLGDAQALIADARAYRDRIARAIQHLQEMRESGISIDLSAAQVSQDARLEAIAEVLPAIDALEEQRDRALDQAERWKSALAND